MNWFNTILGVLLLFILAAIKNIPNHMYKLFEERYKNKNNRQLQIESFFKQISGSKQEEVLSTWTNFLTDMENTTKKYTADTKEGKKLFRNLMHDTLMYGSPRTIKYVGAFKSCNSRDLKDQKQVVLMACIICSLREDFTGYRNSPLDLLKICITDYDKLEPRYKQSWDEIQEEIK